MKNIDINANVITIILVAIAVAIPLHDMIYINQYLAYQPISAITFTFWNNIGDWLITVDNCLLITDCWQLTVDKSYYPTPIWQTPNYQTPNYQTPKIYIL